MTIGHRQISESAHECGATLAPLSATSPQVTIFTGRFGSGKTEIALNYAIHLAKRGCGPHADVAHADVGRRRGPTSVWATSEERTPLLIDLDLVTPYFRARDKVEEMAQYDVETITPFDAGHHVDMPALSPRILGAIEQLTRPVVIDLGGDKQGARALAQYATILIRHRYAMNFVVNPYRPFMGTVAGIRAAIGEIEESAKLQVSALVSNPNLMSESTPELFWGGHCLIQEASQVLGLPIAFAVVADAAHTETWPTQTRGADVGPHPWPTRNVGPPHPPLPVLVIRRFFMIFEEF